MLNAYLDIQPEVAAALAAGKPVVALESTIISHGMPYPQNVETARQVEQVVRDNGAVPATIAILDGRLKVGLDAGALEALGKAGHAATKCSRRDIPFVLANKGLGATTVASTMIIAAMAVLPPPRDAKMLPRWVLWRTWTPRRLFRATGSIPLCTKTITARILPCRKTSALFAWKNFRF